MVMGMAMIGQNGWIVLISFLHLCVRTVTSSELCTYVTPLHQYSTTMCPQVCCRGGPFLFDEEICCRYQYGNGLYIGAGMGVLVVVATSALCCMYVCCRQRLLREARQNSTARQIGRRRGTSTSGSRSDTIPSISVNVEPVLPPPYDDSSPPPYSLVYDGHNVKFETKSYPEEPPPEYTATDSSSTVR